MSIKELDKKALLGAVALMCLSWGALPIIYLMLKKRNKKEKEEVKTDE